MNENMKESTIVAKEAIDNLHKEIDYHWNDAKYTKSIVALIDVMGIKELFLNNPYDFSGHSSIYKSWDKILKTQELEEYKVDIRSKYGEMNVKFTVLSDSIVLSVDVNTPNAFMKIFMMMGLFCHSLFLQNVPYFTRGAVVVGDVYHENNIVFGPAIVKAHLMEKDKAVNFRYIMDKDDFLEIHDYVEDDFKCTLESFFYFDNGFYCYDYLYRFMYYADNRILRNNDKSQFYINALNNIHKKIEHEITNNDNHSVKEKYIWMRKYLNSTISKTIRACDENDFLWLKEALKKRKGNI